MGPVGGTMRKRFWFGALAAAVALMGAPAPVGAADGASHDVLVSTNPADRTPHVLDGEVKAVAEVGNKVIVGGKFTRVKKFSRPDVYTRVGIFAYDKVTGDIDLGFAPVLNGGAGEVRALVAIPGTNHVIVGGTFQNVNGGAYVGGLVKLDATTGLPVSQFRGTTNGWVNDLSLVGNKLYLGGTFSKIRSSARALLGAVDATTGAVDTNLNLPVTVAMRNTAQVWKLDTDPAGTRLVMIGNFTQVGGQARTQVAMIDLSTTPASVSSWHTTAYRAGVCASSYDYYAKDIDVSPDGTYFVIVTTGAWRGTSTLCDSAARWELGAAGPNQLPTWVDYTGGDSLTAVSITGTAVYAAGHQRWHNNAIPPRGDVAGPGAVTRTGIAALDPENGTVLNWDAQRDRGLQVGVLLATTDGLYIGSDSQKIGGEFHPRLAFLPVAGGRTVPKAVVATLPTTLYRSEGDALVGRSYDGTTLGLPTPVAPDGTAWSRIRGVIRASDRTYRALDDGSLEVSVGGGAYTPSPSWITFNNLSGMTYGQGRLLYTIAGDPRLYSRGFAVDSGIVNTLLVDASTGTDWRNVVGLTVIDGKLYHSRTDGNLYRTDLANGRPVAGTTVAVSGPGTDGVSWSTNRALHAAP